MPNSRAVVCSIHFKEEDYKVGLKRKVLQPTAVPTQFPSYPAYMLPAASKKRLSVVRVAPATAITKVGDSLQELCAGSENEASHRSDADMGENEGDVELRATPPHADEVAGPENCLAAGCSVQGGVKAQECQTTFNLTSFMADIKRNAHRLQMQASRLNERLQKLQKKCDGVQEKLKQYEEDRAVQSITKIRKAAAEGDKTAEFLVEQVENFSKARPTWQENTVRECVLWKATSRKGYDHVRPRKLLRLPCRSTL